MTEGPAAPEGVGPPQGQRHHALRELLATVLDALRTRLDLATVELEIYVLRLMHALLWAVAAIVCGLLAVAFALVALVATLWSTHRGLGLLAASLLFVALAAAFGLIGSRRLRTRGGILAGSLGQLERDRQPGHRSATPS
jgi:uncharacterized membrane protein YqjE